MSDFHTAETPEDVPDLELEQRIAELSRTSIRDDEPEQEQSK